MVVNTAQHGDLSHSPLYSKLYGDALATAAANATVRFIIDHDIPAHAKKMGDYFRAGLERFKTEHQPVVTEVRGMGLLLGMQFNDTISLKVVAACNDEGLLLNPVRPDAIRFMPPLIIAESDVDEALAKLDQGLATALKN